MQSKKSYFSKALFVKNLTRFWIVWGLYLIYLLLSVPITLYVRCGNEMKIYSPTEDLTGVKLNCIYRTLVYADSAIVLAVVGLVAALCVFSYMFNSKNAYMFHAFPFDRKELFITNYISGMTYIIIPQFICEIFTILVCFVFEIGSIEYVLYDFAFIMVESILYYSMGVLLCMIIGQAVIVPIFFVIINMLYVGMKYISYQLVMAICYGMSKCLALSGDEMLSPLYCMENKRPITFEYDPIHIQNYLHAWGKNYMIAYLLVSIFLTFCAYFAYQRRKLETVGDIICVGWIKPVFRWGTSIFTGELAAAMLYDIFSSYGAQIKIIGLLTCTAFVSTIIFFLTDMLLEKKLMVFKKQRAYELSVIIVILCLGAILLDMDTFGFEKWLPDVEDVDKVYVELYEPIYCDERQEIQRAVNYHRSMIEYKDTIQKEYSKDREKNNDNVKFKYILKNGKCVERLYSISTDMDVSKNLNRPDNAVEGLLFDIYKDSVSLEHYMEGKFALNYKEMFITGGELGVYDPEKKISNNVIIKVEEMENILEAFKEDVKAGAMRNMHEMYNGDAHAGSDFWYENTIYVSFGIEGGIHDIVDAFYSKNGVQNRNNISDSSSAYLIINKDCENTLKALVDNGIIESTDQLLTWVDYNEIEE